MTHFEVLRLLSNEYPDKASQISFIMAMRKISIAKVRKALYDTTGMYLKQVNNNCFELQSGIHERAKFVHEAWVELAKNEKNGSAY